MVGRNKSRISVWATTHRFRLLFKNYYVPARGPNAPWTERENAAGNHLGQWKLTIDKEIDNQSFSFYLMHPIEDRSGIKWQNYQDNLYGLFWKNKQKQALISSALVEFYFTRNQNVHPTNSIVPPEGQGPINYFNHYIYASGNTY